MAYEDTKCPCGGVKLPDTFLCDECETTFAERSERADMDNAELHIDLRRNAAEILVTLSRGRRRRG